MKTHSDWLREQPQERQQASLEHLDNCQKLGQAQRENPFSPEVVNLKSKIRRYYETEETANDEST